METQNNKWKNRLNFLALSIWLIVSVGVAIFSFIYFSVDFRGYYAAARVLFEGGNPYDYEQVVPVLVQITGVMSTHPYYYPPWFAWLFMPVVFLPFQVARGIWMAFNLVIWNISLWMLSELVNWRRKDWRLCSLFSLSTLTFGWTTLRYEQASIFVFFFLLLTIVSIHKRQWIYTGLCLTFLLVKPNVTLIIVFMICLWLIRNGQWKPILALLTTLVIFSGLALWTIPDLLKPFFKPGFLLGLTSALEGSDQVVAMRINTTLLDWLGIWNLGESYRLLIYGLCILVGIVVLVLMFYRARSLLELTSLSLLVTFFITPYALQYDYAPLVITLFWALSLCNSSTLTKFGGLALTMFIFSVSLWQRNIAWGYWIVLGLIALTIWALSQRSLSPLTES